MSDEKIRKWILYHGKGLTLADEHCLWELCDEIRTQRDAEIKTEIQKWLKSGKPYFIYFTQGLMRNLANILQTEIYKKRDAEWLKAIDNPPEGSTIYDSVNGIIYLDIEKLKSAMKVK